MSFWNRAFPVNQSNTLAPHCRTFSRVLTDCLKRQGARGGGDVVPTAGERATNERDMPRVQNLDPRSTRGREKASVCV